MGQGGFGAPPQPPQFSAGSLVSDNDLPEWLREGAAGQGAQPAWGAPPQSPQPPRQPAFPQPQQSQQPPMPPMPQSWGAPPAPQQVAQRHDIAAEHTIRQPAYSQQNPVAPQPAFYQQPSAPYPPQGGFAQPPAYPPQPYAPQPYPSAPQGYPSAPKPYPLQPAFAQPPSYPSQFAPQQGAPGYPPQFAPQPAPQSSLAQAFPSLDQVGALYNSPPAQGMSGYSLLDPQSGASWLNGMAQPGQFAPRQPVPSGMMARSLVDDQLLPKWLRDQPEAARPNPAEWAAQGQAAAAPLTPPQTPAGYALSPSAFQPLPPSPAGPPLGPLSHGPAPQMGAYQRGYAEDSAMPDWLRAQAGAAPVAGPGAAQGFAASDLIDPAALPAWVSGKAPVEQTFSSTHGWSTINGESPAANGNDTAQGYSGGYDAPQDLQPLPESPFGWDEAGNPAPWDGAGAPGEMGYDENASFGASPAHEAHFNPGHAPLAHEELPPWLQNKVGQAPQASGNPWGNASEQAAPAGGWDEAGWDEQGDQQWNENAAWDENASWDDPRGGRAGGGRDEPWDDSGRDSGRGGYRQGGQDDGRDGNGYDRRGRRDEMSYDDGAYYGEQRYDSRRDERQYDERRDDGRYANRRGAEPEYEYEDEHEPRGGRGWFGFLRRGRR